MALLKHIIAAEAQLFIRANPVKAILLAVSPDFKASGIIYLRRQAPQAFRFAAFLRNLKNWAT